MDLNNLLTPAQAHVLKYAYEHPNHPRTFVGRFADIKNQLLENYLIKYNGDLKYELTDLGYEKLKEYLRSKNSRSDQ